MADQDERRTHRLELAFEPLDGRQIEMIGRFVEEENVGRRREHARERGTARLAARKASGCFSAVKAELSEKVMSAVPVVARRQSGLDKSARGGETGEIGLLR